LEIFTTIKHERKSQRNTIKDDFIAQRTWLWGICKGSC